VKRTALLENESGDIKYFVEEIRERYGYEFGDRDLSLLKLDLQKQMAPHKKENISESSLLEKAVSRFVSRRVMFQTPAFYRALRKKIIPLLRTYPSVRIWLAGCSTGEEAFGLSVLLHEEGIPRFKIYATDFSEKQLKKAALGKFPLRSLEEWEKNYIKSKGTGSLSNFYSVRNSYGVFEDKIKNSIVFFHHNLATDASFHEFQLILCRNILLYFGSDSRERVHKLFYDSLCKFGVLGLGVHESLHATTFENRYLALDAKNKLFRRTG
jgi:chemotaxis protein methyltransferase CheR